MNPYRLAMFQRKLLERRGILADDMAQMIRSALERCRLGAVGDDLADLSTDAYERELTLSMIESEEGELMAIDDALERIHGGTYGICEACGRKIPMARLKVVPHARRCIKCKRVQEKQEGRKMEQFAYR
ncbi:MAG: TraR/DksA family transcriptional regulator [Planctomycetes bacterium]|nr:TraR/DksA family transcriptional regulator [Planctomycetota bacterium]